LQSLQIGLDINSEDDIVPPTVTLTNLTSLSVDLRTCDPGQDWLMQLYNQISAVLSLLDSSSLKSLFVMYDAIIFPAPQSPFHGMSLNNLQTLGLQFPLTPEALTDCLLSVPNITSLYLVDLGNWDELHHRYTKTTLQDTHLSRLSLPAGNPSSLCPKLQHIRIVDNTDVSRSLGDYESWSGIALADFLEARVRSKALDSFDLFSYSSMRSSLEAQLGRFVRLKEECGLELHLRQAHKSSQSVDLPTTGLYPMQYSRGDTDTIV
jgi:hypothetical protein